MSLEPGTVVGGDFEILSPLSSGGMGAVFIAQQRSVGRKRALKVMHRELLADAKMRDRFIQEAKIGATIDSEHIVEVIAAGIDEKLGMPFLAMELLEGKDLAAVVMGRTLSLIELSEIMDQVCHALGAAHAAGVVHRDLKPENIFITKSRMRGQPFIVKILDFGIAKVIAEARATSAGTAALGTPTYMAPEQTEPRGKVTAAADVWALGLIVFRALTGKLFWKSSNEEGSGITSLMREVVIDPIPSAVERATELGVADLLPAGFDKWFSRCVDRNPAGRFQDAIQMYDAMESIAGFGAAAGGGTAARLSDLRSGLGAQLGPSKNDTPPVPTVMAAPIGTDAPVVDPTGPKAPIPLAPQPTRKKSGSAGLVVVGGVAVLAVAGVAVFALKSPGGSSGGSAATPKPSEVSSSAAPVASTVSTPSLPPLSGPLENKWVEVSVPSAPITLGLSDERSPPKVRGLRPSRKIKSPAATYSIQAHEVTWSELEPFLEATPKMKFEPPATVPASASERARLAVVGVPWEVATAYCQSIGGTLPTEEQWEHAARGAEKRTYAWGSEPIDTVRTHAFAGADGGVIAVMTSDQDVTPNGVFDMMGNAREWTSSLWTDDAKDGPVAWAKDGDTTARVVRGWPLSIDAPADLQGFYSEYREWVCATGACSPLHPDKKTKPPLQPIVVQVDPGGGKTSPLAKWVANPAFSSQLMTCLGTARLEGASTWTLRAEPKTTPCPSTHGLLWEPKHDGMGESLYVFASQPKKAAPPPTAAPSARVPPPSPIQRDADHDGIVDSKDMCPELPEDKDAFQDDDGCPDSDNDADGVEDRVDRCPMEKGAKPTGCPEATATADKDKDGVPDAKDKCPNEKGATENQGCPKGVVPPSKPSACQPTTRISLVSKDPSAEMLQCLNDGAPIVMAANAKWDDEVVISVVAGKVPTTLAEIGFRCVKVR